MNGWSMSAWIVVATIIGVTALRFEPRSFGKGEAAGILCVPFGTYIVFGCWLPRNVLASVRSCSVLAS